MRQLSSLLNGLAKSLYAGKRKVPGAEEGREAADELRREAKKNDTILRSSGSTRSCVSVFSQRGEKGVNQDCYIVWEVWDAISNQEAVNIVSSTKDRRKSAKRLVERAVCAWKRKRRGVAVDDCSAICLFFH
ncbi:hypothetical protein B296_00008154 [Ensete ventricosum]|uniref:protein-serine/threonine phosphatase n=1 Tax=Ensete ventricosum TaxID=4639 RepID=A0A426ZYV3_ENSVE|nr:hypothetical protein B296_00008154 [Ensete ventricosum]